jgi:hypothetical protein
VANLPPVSLTPAEN